MSEDRPNAYSVAALGPECARLWLSLDYWTREDAKYLLHALDPALMRQHELANGGECNCLLPETFPEVTTLLQRSEQSGGLSFPAAPASVVEWAMSKNLRLPATLIPEGHEVRGGKWLSRARVHFGRSAFDTRPAAALAKGVVAPECGLSAFDMRPAVAFAKGVVAPDFVATIAVERGQTYWRASEVPAVTASALFEFMPEPDPLTSKTELRRFTAAEIQSRVSSGQPLSADELAQLANACREEDLPQTPDELSYSRWGEYLEAFNRDADRRGWWVGLNPPKEASLGERLCWTIAADEHRNLLKAALKDGKVSARLGGTLIPAEPGMVALERLVLTRTELQRFAAMLAIQVVDLPHFVRNALPKEVPAELAVLPADAQISYEHSIGRERGSGITSAGAYRRMILDTMARQADGHFTLNEAAQVLADIRPGLDPTETVKRLRSAHEKGELAIHQGGSRFPLEVGETIRDFLDTLDVTELDAWLRASVGHGFPVAPGTSNEQTIAPGGAEVINGMGGKSGKRWTDAALAELREYREKHGTKEAAKRFNVSEARVRRLLPTDKPKAKGFSAFSHRPK